MTILVSHQAAPHILQQNCAHDHKYVFREENSFRPTSAWYEVPCWQQQLECEWNAKRRNYEADAQAY